jgi:hypothetical protein
MDFDYTPEAERFRKQLRCWIEKSWPRRASVQWPVASHAVEFIGGAGCPRSVE